MKCDPFFIQLYNKINWLESDDDKLVFLFKIMLFSDKIFKTLLLNQSQINDIFKKKAYKQLWLTGNDYVGDFSADWIAIFQKAGKFNYYSMLDWILLWTQLDYAEPFLNGYWVIYIKGYWYNVINSSWKLLNEWFVWEWDIDKSNFFSSEYRRGKDDLWEFVAFIWFDWQEWKPVRVYLNSQELYFEWNNGNNSKWEKIKDLEFVDMISMITDMELDWLEIKDKIWLTKFKLNMRDYVENVNSSRSVYPIFKYKYIIWCFVWKEIYDRIVNYWHNSALRVHVMKVVTVNWFCNNHVINLFDLLNGYTILPFLWNDNELVWWIISIKLFKEFIWHYDVDWLDFIE